MLAWRAKSMTLVEFEVLLFLIGAGLRLHAAAGGHRAAKQRLDPHVRIGRRHHAVLAQSVRHDPGGGVRRDHPVRRRARLAGAPSASIPSRASSTCSSPSPRASRSALVAVVLLEEKPLETKHTLGVIVRDAKRPPSSRFCAILPANREEMPWRSTALHGLSSAWRGARDPRAIGAATPRRNIPIIRSRS